MEEEDSLALPPGFRFHPTDEELITHYLVRKVADADFTSLAIGEIDLNKCEPWDLPSRAKMGEREWYFFCLKDRKYPTGQRTNRATDAGYWKATGKDREIHRGKSLVGMKKTLVFYLGRAPKGEKSNWVMHEFRLDGFPPPPIPLHSPKNEWVICRVFAKAEGSCGKRSAVEMSSEVGDEMDSANSYPLLPPLMDLSSSKCSVLAGYQAFPPTRSPCVTCFSNAATNDHGWTREVQDQELAAFLPAGGLLQQNLSAPLLSSGSRSLTSNVSLVQLLEGNCGIQGTTEGTKMKQAHFKLEKETGFASDMNPEIFSLVSNHQEVPSSSSANFHIDEVLWSY